MRSGVLLVATGKKYVEEALPLIQSIRSFMPDTDIHLITDIDTEFDDSLFDSHERIKFDLEKYPTQFRGFLFRDLALEKSPFDYTIHMDCDTILGSAVYEMFHALQRFELVVGAAPAKIRSYGCSSNTLPERCKIQSIPVIPRINCGVIGYNRSLIDSGFIKLWAKLYIQGMEPAIRKGRNKFSDQSVFRKTLWESRVNFLLLPPEFNFRTGAPQFLEGPVRIAHGRPPMGRETLIEFVNCTEEQRLYFPYRCLHVRQGRDWATIPIPNSVSNCPVAHNY